MGPDDKFYPNPSEDDPPEAPEDSAHGVSKFQQIHRPAARACKLQEQNFLDNRSTYLSAIADVEDESEGPTQRSDSMSSGDDFFGDIDKAISLQRKEFVKQGLLKPNPKKEKVEIDGLDELEPDEVVDLEEIDELQELRVVSKDSDWDGSARFDDEEVSKFANSNRGSSLNSSFDVGFDSYGKIKSRIVEPKFRMSLAELLEESKVLPVSVYGDLEVEITGIQHDSRLVCSGDLFVCCVGRKTNGAVLGEKRGLKVKPGLKFVNKTASF